MGWSWPWLCWSWCLWLWPFPCNIELSASTVQGLHPEKVFFCVKHFQSHFLQCLQCHFQLQCIQIHFLWCALRKTVRGVSIISPKVPPYSLQIITNIPNIPELKSPQCIYFLLPRPLHRSMYGSMGHVWETWIRVGTITYWQHDTVNSLLIVYRNSHILKL